MQAQLKPIRPLRQADRRRLVPHPKVPSSEATRQRLARLAEESSRSGRNSVRRRSPPRFWKTPCQACPLNNLVPLFSLERHSRTILVPGEEESRHYHIKDAKLHNANHDAHESVWRSRSSIS